MNPFLTPLFLARNVIVDKQILALTYRGDCPFRHYLLSTTEKDSVKTWTVCVNATSYALKMLIYRKN